MTVKVSIMILKPIANGQLFYFEMSKHWVQNR